jgi:hypothetical protein
MMDMTEQELYLGAITLRFAVWVEADDRAAVTAVLRHIRLEDLIAISGAADWEGARYDVDAAPDDALDEPVEIRVLRALPLACAPDGAEGLGVAYKITQTGERFWNDAYAGEAERAYRRGELAPIWRHLCARCVYLGQYLHAGREYDLYVAEACAHGGPTPLARWSDAAEDVVGAEMEGELREEAARRVDHWRASASGPQ